MEPPDLSWTAYLVKTRLNPQSVRFLGAGAEGLADRLRDGGVLVEELHPVALSLPEHWAGLGGAPLAEPPQSDLTIVVAGSLDAPESVIPPLAKALSASSDSVLLYQVSSRWAGDPAWRSFIPQWVASLALVGLVRDLAFEYQPFSSRLLLFRRTAAELHEQLARYEEQLQTALMMSSVSLDLARSEMLAQGGQVSDGDIRVQHDELVTMVRDWGERWLAMESSLAWPLVTFLQGLRSRLAPPQGVVERTWEFVRPRVNGARQLRVAPVRQAAHPAPSQTSVDVVVCVHDALEDVQRCLDSVIRHTTIPYSLILVDDGSSQPTRQLLGEYADRRGATLLRSSAARGYTIAANQGLRASNADFVVLLNSDTIVSTRWLVGMLACAQSDDRIGLVGPLSNTASWQSIPKISDGGDWAHNALPEGLSIAEMAGLVRTYSPVIYPRVHFLNGFCLMLRRQMLDDVGLFDEKRFGEGYGEEDDLALRARRRSWDLAVADDVYVYHAQSRSYSDERRQQLSSRALKRLIRKHGRGSVDKGVHQCMHSRVMEGIRARSSVLWERYETVQRGLACHSGRRVLFVLPVAMPGGGANVVLSEARAMKAMGVDVRVFNLPKHRAGFEAAYPHPGVPVVYGSERDVVTVKTRYDAVVATHNESVRWFGQAPWSSDAPVHGYYIQGFEPLMYPAGSRDYQRALDSYRLCPDMVRMVKTEWTGQKLVDSLSLGSHMVWPSVEVDRFLPRPRAGRSWPERRLRVAAMIRPGVSYRAPEMTMQVLQQIKHRHPRAVDVWVFGADPGAPGFGDLPHSFHYRSAGILVSEQVAGFLNEVDVFLDLSEHQAMGLTAMEAMACGAAVVVPMRGGASSFVVHRHNGLLVDTDSVDECLQAVHELVSDHDLRQQIQHNSLWEIVRWFPERSALAILDGLFADGRCAS